MAHEILRTVAKVAVGVVAAAGISACGGGQGGSGRIGPQGGTVVAAGARVSFPAGALSRETEIELSELPRREGEPRRIRVGPDDAALSRAATIVVTSDDGDAADERLVSIERQGELEIEHGLEVERHRESEHGREAEIRHLGEFELRHARACDVACGAGLECDDGACKPHGSDDPALVTSTAAGSCPAGWELDESDAICKPHGGSGL